MIALSFGLFEAHFTIMNRILNLDSVVSVMPAIPHFVPDICITLFYLHLLPTIEEASYPQGCVWLHFFGETICYPGFVCHRVQELVEACRHC